MTGVPQMADMALDRTLAASATPMMPAGLPGRITATATASSQRQMRGPFKARRTRWANRKGRARRPVIFGTIGGGLLAVSAMAAALGGDGRFDFARITKPVIEFFVPDQPIQTASVQRAAPDSTPALVRESGAAAASDAGQRTLVQRPGWSGRQLRRAYVLRQRMERLRLRQNPVAGPAPIVRPRLAQRQSLQRSRPADGAGLTPTQQRRLDRRLERRDMVAPQLRDRIIDRRRDRAIAVRSDRPAGGALQQTGLASPPVRIDQPVGAPTRLNDAPTLPVAAGPTPASQPALIENTSPGPLPQQLPDVRPALTNGDMPATNNARRVAILERVQASQAARRARAQRPDAPRPQRPRIPRRRH